MRLSLAAAAAVLVLAPACKKKKSSLADVVAKMSEFKDKMCACKDLRCATQVQEEMTRYAEELAKKASDHRPEPISEEDSKRYTEATTRMAECAQKAMGTPLDSPVDASVPAVDAPPPENVTNADRMIKLAFDARDPVVMQEVAIRYVHADGTLDDEYGEASFAIGKPKPPDPADDPRRPLGAPVREAASTDYDILEKCPRFLWKHGTRTERSTLCFINGRGISRPKCSVVEVWKRAIDKGAPAGGLAVLVLQEGPPQTWSFAIDDEPRKVHFAIAIEDTCAPTLENPQ